MSRALAPFARDAKRVEALCPLGCDKIHDNAGTWQVQLPRRAQSSGRLNPDSPHREHHSTLIFAHSQSFIWRCGSGHDGARSIHEQRIATEVIPHA
ncbi:hypothetical protein [Novosphingobium mathurense]|uniref:hypothetical protein n=1 Tax=Novosphingobium mathurense TaxID=428990 RepID=UPI001C37A5BF|nr:hypothetical protein [Novosphingobium mathurense]